VVDPRKKVLDLNCEVQDLLLEVVDLKQEMLDPVGSPSQFNHCLSACSTRNRKKPRVVAILRGVVVNFDLGERFPRPRSQQRGSLHVAVLGVGAEGGRMPYSPHPIQSRKLE